MGKQRILKKLFQAAALPLLTAAVLCLPAKVQSGLGLMEDASARELGSGSVLEGYVSKDYLMKLPGDNKNYFNTKITMDDDSDVYVDTDNSYFERKEGNHLFEKILHAEYFAPSKYQPALKFKCACSRTQST